MNVTVSQNATTSRSQSQDSVTALLPDTEIGARPRCLSPEQRVTGPAYRPGPRATSSTPWRAVALIDNHKFTRDCIATCLEMLCHDLTVTTFPSLADCIAAGLSDCELVIYYSHGCTAQASSRCAALLALRQEFGPTPILVVSDEDEVGTVLEALTAGIRGYIPTVNTSLHVTVEVMHLLRAGGTFAPVATSMMIQNRLQPDVVAIPSPDRFTPRQIAVLECLKHGSANKAIAHELSMSEGTVKVHVRNIMKKLRATNRTQAVFRAYNLGAVAESAGAVARSNALA